MRNLKQVALAVAIGLALVSSIEAKGFPNVKQLGKTVVAHQDERIKAVASYRWSSKNGANPWMIVDLAVSAEGSQEVTIHREGVSIVSPDGDRIPLATQARLNERFGEIAPRDRAATIARDPIDGYFPGRNIENAIQFFRLPEDRGVVFDQFSANRFVLAEGRLYFESPVGTWKPGLYTLEITGEKGIRVELPIEIRE